MLWCGGSGRGRCSGGGAEAAPVTAMSRGQNSALGTRAPAMEATAAPGETTEMLASTCDGETGKRDSEAGMVLGWSRATTAVTTRAAAAGHTVAVNNGHAHLYILSSSSSKIVQNRREIIEEIVGGNHVVSSPPSHLATLWLLSDSAGHMDCLGTLFTGIPPTST